MRVYPIFSSAPILRHEMSDMNSLLGALPPLPVVRQALREAWGLAARGGVSAGTWLDAAVLRRARLGACGRCPLAACAVRS